MKKIYRNYIKNIVSDPEVQTDKKLFMETHFPRQSVWFRPSFIFVPALSALIIALGIVIGPNMISERQETNVLIEDAPAVFQIHPVGVKRASSRVGNIMVYQKLYNEDPMTIVWVFPTSGGPHAAP